MSQTIAARLKKQAKRDDAEVIALIEEAGIIQPSFFDEYRRLYPRLTAALNRAEIEVIERYGNKSTR